MKKLLFLFVSFLWLSNVSAQTFNVTDPVPFDALVRTGTLPNGLKYYIRKNVKPEHRAELRLVVNAGSILESDNQQGLAHLMEHMCFNGTENFKKSALVDYLESVGMNFGADLNASTSWDETVYMLQIPTDTPAIFEKGMQIIEDWSHNVSLENTEIDKERGVVVEEWRRGQGAEERMLRKYFPVMFYQSQYANRLPIGKKEIIEGAPYDTLKQFYKDWYRPDNMAVVAVGDFDVDAVEQMIKQKFSPITNPSVERKRKIFDVPVTDSLMVSVCTDKEASYNIVQIITKLPPSSETTIGDYRESIKHQLFSNMLNKRYEELMQKADPPFSYAASDYTRQLLARTISGYESVAIVSDDGIERGLKTLLDENLRVKKFGFTASEFDRAKKEMLRGMENSFNEKDKTDSKSFTREYVSNFLVGEPSPGIDWEYQMWQNAVPNITLEEVNQLANQWIGEGKNTVVIVLAPEKDGVKVPTEQRVKEIFKQEQSASIIAYSDKVLDKPLMKKAPKGGKVVTENTIATYNITEWTLSNGAKVILKPTDFKNDQILFEAYSFGGSSLCPDKDFMSASYADNIITKSGLGPYNASDLSKYLSDKVVSLSSSIGQNMESLYGNAAPKDLETMLQMLYLYFTAPKKDSTGFKSMMSQQMTDIQNRNNDPSNALRDTLSVVMHQHNFRYRPVNEQILKEIDMNRAYDIFKDRFADGGEFTYVFVGNFKPADIKPLIENYIGGLPTLHRNETFKNLGIVPPTGQISKTVLKGKEPKSTVILLFSGKADFNRHNEIETDALTSLVEIKLLKTLREDMSGVYSPGGWSSLEHYPDPRYRSIIYFNCAPENVEKLIAASISVLDSIKQKGCSDKDLVKVKEMALKAHETNLKENNFWLNAIVSNYQDGENILEMQDFEKQINSLTSDDFKRIAAKYFSMDNYAKFVLDPEKTP